ncbi:MAG: RimK-like protein [Hyphomicrobiaceae bacterium]
MKNTERLLVASLRRYASLRGYELVEHGDGWIVEIRLGRRSHFVHGYDLGLNSSSSLRVANDKAATFEALSRGGVPAVPHRLFMHPRFLGFMSVDGNWRHMLEAFEEFGRDVVIKDNEGTGGMEMARVRSVAGLELETQRLFGLTRGIALSPFLEIEQEVRFVLLENTCLAAYTKDRSTVTGDGRSTLAELALASVAARQLDPATIELDGPSLAAVPPAGKTIAVQWRHNLGYGAQARRVDPHDPAQADAATLARQAFDRLGLRFASIDVVRSGGGTMVLEANSGVMLEVMARGNPDGGVVVDSIYHRALDLAIEHSR